MLQSFSHSEALTGEAPVLVTINGIPHWKSGGRTFPVIAGAEDPPSEGNNDQNKQESENEDSGSDFDKDRALSTIRAQREKEAKLLAELKELRPLKAKIKEHEDAQKSEAERLASKLAELERSIADKDRSLAELRKKRAIERAAAKQGAADPDDIFRLLDPDDFEMDDDGNVKNADALVKELLKVKPYLASKASHSGVPATPKANGQPVTHEDMVKTAREKLIETRQYTPLG